MTKKMNPLFEIGGDAPYSEPETTETTDAETLQRAEPQDAILKLAKTVAFDIAKYVEREFRSTVAYDAQGGVTTRIVDAIGAAQQASTNALLVPSEEDQLTASTEVGYEDDGNAYYNAQLGFFDGVRWLLDWQRAQQVRS